jgi:hypothetical protein
MSWHSQKRKSFSKYKKECPWAAEDPSSRGSQCPFELDAIESVAEGHQNVHGGNATWLASAFTSTCRCLSMFVTRPSVLVTANGTCKLIAHIVEMDAPLAEPMNSPAPVDM